MEYGHRRLWYIWDKPQFLNRPTLCVETQSKGAATLALDTRPFRSLTLRPDGRRVDRGYPESSSTYSRKYLETYHPTCVATLRNGHLLSRVRQRRAWSKTHGGGGRHESFTTIERSSTAPKTQTDNERPTYMWIDNLQPERRSRSII